MMTDSGLNITRHALAEHHKMDELLEQLTGDGILKSKGWLAIAKKLSETDIITYKKRSMVSTARKILARCSKDCLAKQYQRNTKVQKLEKTVWFKSILNKDGDCHLCDLIPFICVRFGSKCPRRQAIIIQTNANVLPQANLFFQSKN